MASTTEVDVEATFMNGKQALPFCVTLEDLKHPQSPTHIQVDNSTEDGFTNGTVKFKLTKAIDTLFHCITDHCTQ